MESRLQTVQVIHCFINAQAALPEGTAEVCTQGSCSQPHAPELLTQPHLTSGKVVTNLLTLLHIASKL